MARSIATNPGTEVLSFGANAFLPGTARAKYGGAGYVILSENLERLADGADDEAPRHSPRGWPSTGPAEPRSSPRRRRGTRRRRTRGRPPTSRPC